MLGKCENCGRKVPIAGVGRPRRTCSTRCRTALHRARRLPTELRSQARWVRHDAAKRPLTIRGELASSTDPATWTDHARAARSKVGTGLGFVLGDGVACLDIDHCLDVRGRPNALARQVLAATTGAYTEISPSGDGLHIWGTAPEQPGRARGGIEAYSTDRYITVTRNVYRPGGLVDLSAFF